MRGAIRASGFGYRHGERNAAALSGIDLAIDPGERVLVTGDSGAGKSTLLAAIAGVLGGADEGERSGTLTVSGTVGLVLQDPDSQVIASRVGDDVAFGAENLGVDRDTIWRRVRAALEMVGLALPLRHPTSRLSGGQKQRLALAGVLAMGADIVLLDEPTANLDPGGAADVVRAVDRITAEAGITLLVVEHRPARWVNVVDRHLHLGPHGIEDRTSRPLPALDLPPARSPRETIGVSARELRPPWGPARSLILPEGSSTVITGPNGAGKTTLLLTLAGLDAPRSGTAEYSPTIRDGLSTPPHRWRSAELSRRIGTVFQNPEHQFVARTVAGELRIGDPDPARVDMLMDSLRLDHLAGANPFTLSGGEKRRLSVATALVGGPRLLLLDEPTFGQDDHTFQELARLLRELTDEGVTVAAVTHDPDYMATLGDHRVEVG